MSSGIGISMRGVTREGISSWGYTGARMSSVRTEVSMPRTCVTTFGLGGLTIAGGTSISGQDTASWGAGISSLSVIFTLCWLDRPFQDYTTRLNLIPEVGEGPEEGGKARYVGSRWMSKSRGDNYWSPLYPHASLVSCLSIQARDSLNSINTCNNQCKSSLPCEPSFGLSTNDQQRMIFSELIVGNDPDLASFSVQCLDFSQTLWEYYTFQWPSGLGWLSGPFFCVTLSGRSLRGLLVGLLFDTAN